MDDDPKNRPRGFSYGFGGFGPTGNFGANDEFFNAAFRHDFDQIFHDMETFMNNIGIPIISNIEYVESMLLAIL